MTSLFISHYFNEDGTMTFSHDTGLAMALMLCVVDVGTIVFQRANNSLGEVYITAYTSARRLINLMFQPVFSLSTATSTFVGQNWGARKLDRIRKTLNKIYATGIAWAVFSAARARHYRFQVKAGRA